MRILDYVTQSLTQLKSNRGRTILTLLGIIFGAASLMAMLAIGAGTQAEIASLMDAMGPNVTRIRSLTLDPGKIPDFVQKSAGLSQRDITELRDQLPEVRRFGFLKKIQISAFDMPLDRPAIQVIGVSPEEIRIDRLSVQAGRNLHPLDETHHHRVALISAGLVKASQGKLAVGQWIRLRDVYFQIVGILSATTSQDSSFGLGSYHDAIVLPYATLVHELEPAGAYNELDMISAEVADAEQTLALKASLEPRMAVLHGHQPDWEVIAPLEIVAQKEQTQRILNIVFTALALVSMVVGGIGVMNIMLANIMERIAEIGLRRSVGARVDDIFKQFLAEAIVICSIGGIVGVLFGSVTTLIAGWIFTIPLRFSLLSLLMPFLASTLVGVIFGVLPAKRAAHITPIEALQHD